MPIANENERVYTNPTAYARGELRNDAALQDKLQGNLDTLKYLEGSGMTTRQKFDIREDTVYLMIGLGGQGIRKLGAVKRQLYKDCNAEGIDRSVRFLAIDTDLRSLSENKNFSSTEKCEIRPGTASVLADSNNPNFLPWVHPQLNIHITGMVGALGWAGDGAGQCRQAGRVKLADSNNRALVQNKVAQAIHDMCGGITKNVRVIIIAGLAGGTGSGTIVDIPYIVRAVNGTQGIQLNPTAFTLEGYVLLPPACGVENDPHKAAAGNRNAYAALKEIDYLMTLGEMHAANPEAKYEFCGITSTENIFNTCVLVDGMPAATNAVVRDTAKLADEIVAHTIVTSITDITGGNGNKNAATFFGSTNYISNLRSVGENQLLNTDYIQCPREANYRFLSSGYAEVVIPVDLMKVYVANKVFQRIWADYTQAFNVRKQNAETFLNDAGLTVRALHDMNIDDLRDAYLPERAQRHIDQTFKEKGPYYMINLMRAIQDLMTDDYINQQHRGNRGTWGETKHKLKRYRKILLDQQRKDFIVYTVVIEELQKILANDAHILTNTERRKSTFDETFYWEPIDLSSGENSQQAVKAYLDGLLSDKEISDFADQFRDDLVANRKHWASLFDQDSQFDAAAEVRSFIDTKIGNKVNATIEDFLVKLYSGDSNATASGMDAASQKALDTAVENIFNYFNAHSAPLAAMEPTDAQVFHNGLRNFIVPASAPNIRQRLVTQPNVEANCVYTGSADDRFICITMYAGVPAFFYKWIKDGEDAYEKEPHFVGLHMEQTDGKTIGGWADFPNLLPEARKRNLGLWQANGREEVFLRSERELMEQARELGLVVTDENVSNYTYRLLLLADSMNTTGEKATIDTAKQAVQNFLASAAHPFTIGKVRANILPGMDQEHNLVDDLVAQGILVEVKLVYGTQTLTPGCDMTEQERIKYNWELAIKLLRKSLFTTERLQQTVEVMKYFENEVSNRNARYAFEWKMQRRMDDFRKMLASEVLENDALECNWFYTVDRTKHILVSYADEKRIAQKYNLYLAYICFANLPEEVYLQITEEYKDTIPEERKKPAFLNETKRKYHDEMIYPLTVEDDRHGEFQMRAANFPEKVERAGWYAGEKLVTANDLREFYDTMELEMRPMPVSNAALTLTPDPTPSPASASSVSSGLWVCPKCGKTDNAMSFKFCPGCGERYTPPIVQSGSWICPECGKTDNAESAKFCPQCGAKRPEQGWVCADCQTSNAESARFCSGCGKKRL